MRVRSTVVAAAACTVATFSLNEARADQFHYNNLLIGTRAMGLGGAFGAVADDASGIYYNPAGLAFALSNDISGSANAFYSKTTTYKQTLGNDDFVETSGGSVAPFFGGLQKLDRYVPGLVFAFGVYHADNDLKDQDTTIVNKTLPTATIERYHRTSNARAGTYYAGAGAGIRLNPNLAIGGGLHYFSADELVQEYQDAKQTVTTTTGETAWRILTSNVRERLTVAGIQPVIGLQAALPGNVALGLTVKKGIIASEQLQLSSETRTQLMSVAGHDQLASDKQTSAVVTENITPDPGSSPNSEKPIGDWPAEVRFGTAWFASPVFMLTFDVTYHSGITTGEKLAANGNKPKYNRDAVVDYGLGTEYYLSPSFPLRFGLFTNNDSRPEVKKGPYDKEAKITCGDNADFRLKYCGQPDHIDYVGGSVFIGWVQPNTQFAAGAVLQKGEGKAQKLGDHQIQEVDATARTLAFSVTQNL